MKLFPLSIPCLLLGLFLSGQVSAQIDAPPAAKHPKPVPGQAVPAYVAKARKAIDAILAEPEFDRTSTIKRKKHKEKPPAWFSNLSKGGQFFALFLEIALWLLLLGLLVLLVAYLRHWLPFFGWRRPRDSTSPPGRQSDSALEIAEALPEDLITAVECFWREGKKEKALSLLYRGTIELLTARHRIDLPQGATEEEIRLLVGNAMPSFKNDFSNIARAWLRLAYAHRPPADIAELLAGFRHLQQAEGAAS
jgi:hypothetical protein